MKKMSLWLAGMLAAATVSFAQNQPGTLSSSYPGKTTFFAEVGGPGVLFSANIDTRFQKSTLGWGGRAGVGFVTVWDYNGTTMVDRRRSIATFPIQVNYVFGKSTSPHTFEAGAGATVLSRKADVFNTWYQDERSQVFGTFSFMYRRQPVNGGFAWRIGFTPLIGNGFIQPSAGASVGYSF